MAKGFWNALTSGTAQGFNQSFGKGWESQEAREYQKLVQEDYNNIVNIQKMYEQIVPVKEETQRQAVIPTEEEQNVETPKFSLAPNLKGMQLSTLPPEQRQTEQRSLNIIPERQLKETPIWSNNQQLGKQTFNQDRDTEIDAQRTALDKQLPSEPIKTTNKQTTVPEGSKEKWGYRNIATRDADIIGDDFIDFEARQQPAILANLATGEQIVKQAEQGTQKTLSGLLGGLAKMRTPEGRKAYENWIMREDKTPDALTEVDRQLIPLIAQAYGDSDNESYSMYYTALSNYGRKVFDEQRAGLARNKDAKPLNIKTTVSLPEARVIAEKQGIPFNPPTGTTNAEIEYDKNTGQVIGLKPYIPSKSGSASIIGGKGADAERPIITKTSSDKITEVKYFRGVEKNIVLSKEILDNGKRRKAFDFSQIGEFDTYDELLNDSHLGRISENSRVDKGLLADAVWNNGQPIGTDDQFVISYDEEGKGVNLISRGLYENFAIKKNNYIEEAKKNFRTAQKAHRPKDADGEIETFISLVSAGDYNPQTVTNLIMDSYRKGDIPENAVSYLFELIYYKTGYVDETSKILTSNIDTMGD